MVWGQILLHQQWCYLEMYIEFDRFLDYFGLKSKNDLIPVNKEFEIIEDVDLFDTKYKENV